MHRAHYHEPGYIMSSSKILNGYNSLIDKITKYRYVSIPETVTFTHEPTNDTYKLTVGDQLFRDWFKEKDFPYNTIYSLQIDKPKNLSNQSVVVEIFYELTYYKFPTND